MLYIFDLGNVIVDIDFNGCWGLESLQRGTVGDAEQAFYDGRDVSPA